MWPFRTKNTGNSPEKRQSAPYTDNLINVLEAQAVGQGIGDPSAIAALEAAVALYSRAFAAATVTPAEAGTALTPAVRALIARNLIRRGEDFHRLYVRDGRVVLQPCGFAYAHGDGPEEESWIYNCTLYGPTDSRHEWVPSASMLHTRYSVDSSRPWFGQGPMHWAHRTGTLAGVLESRLSEEAGGPVGHILAVPSDGGDGTDDDPLAALKSDLAGARGRTVLTETTAAGWGEGKMAAPQADYKPQRFGAAVPESSVSLRTEASTAVLSACGVPVSLVTDADGTSQREAWRRFVMGSVEPLLAIVGQEVETKLDMSVTFDLSALWAHDLAGRASSFKSLVTGGMAIERAAMLSGLVGAAD